MTSSAATKSRPERRLGSTGLTRVRLRLRFWYAWARKEALDITNSVDAVALKIALGFAFRRVRRDSLWDTAYIDERHVWGVRIEKSLFVGRLSCGRFQLSRDPIYDVRLGAIGGLSGTEVSIDRYNRGKNPNRLDRTRYDYSPEAAEELKEEVRTHLTTQIRHHGAALRGVRRWVANSAAEKLEPGGDEQAVFTG